MLAPVPRRGDAQAQRARRRRAEDEVRGAADAQQAPQHGLLRCPLPAPWPRPSVVPSHAPPVGQRDVAVLGVVGPPPAEPVAERVALRGREVDRARAGRARPPAPAALRAPAVAVAVAVAGVALSIRAVRRRIPGATRRPATRSAAGRARSSSEQGSTRGASPAVTQRAPDRVVERLVLAGRHLGVPVAAAGEDVAGGPAGTALPADEQVVEHVRGRHVEQDLREVLAADQVDVVDAQVDRRHLVARRPAGALPLHHGRQPSPQPVVGGEEGLAVGPGGVELGVEGAAGAQAPRGGPTFGGEAVHHRRAGAHRLVDAGQIRACRGRCRARSPWCGRSASTHPGTARGSVRESRACHRGAGAERPRRGHVRGRGGGSTR